MNQQEQSAAGGPELVHNEGQARYEVRIDGQLAGQAQYRHEDRRVVFTHTEIDSAREGQGLGSRLAAFALDDVRARGLKAVPRCSFIAGFITRHEKEYGALVEH